MRKLVRIALGLLALGIPAVAVVNGMEARGVDPAVAAEAVRRARDASERINDPGQPDVFKHRVALYARRVDAAAAGQLVADTLCEDVADAGFPAEEAACRAAQAATFSTTRICNASDVHVGFYAELSARDRDVVALQAAEARAAGMGIIFEAATPAIAATRLAARNLKRCPEVGP